MIVVLIYVLSDKVDECIFYIFKVCCFFEKRDNF